MSDPHLVFLFYIYMYNIIIYTQKKLAAAAN